MNSTFRGTSSEKSDHLGWLLALFLLTINFINLGSSTYNNKNIALLSIALSLGIFLKKKTGTTYSETGFLLLITPAVLIFISMFVSDIGWHWPRLLTIISALLLGAAIYLWSSEGRPADLKPAILAISIAMLLHLVALISQWTTLESPYSHKWGNDLIFFRNIRHLGYVLLVGLMASSWLLLSARNTPARLYAISILTITFGMACWSGSRGTLLSFLLGLLILSMAFPLFQLSKKWLGIFLSCMLGAALSLLFPVESRALGILSAIFRTASSESFQELGTGRLGIWISTIERIMQHPWFGWGPEAFIQLQIKPGFVQTHNGILQLQLEGGIFFTATIITLIFLVARNGFHALRRMPYAASLESNHILALSLSTSIALITLSMTDGIFYHATPLMTLVTFMSLTAAYSRSR